MTIEELRAIVLDIHNKSQAIFAAANDLESFMQQVEQDVADSNPMSIAINVDQYVSIQSPIYVAKLTALETASDALGTDALH